MIPWLFAGATAIWFGLLAHRAKHNRAVWAVAGALLGLVITTIVLGLGDAVFIPFTREEYFRFRAKEVGVALGLILLLGWVLTTGLHRRHRVLSNGVKQEHRMSGKNPTSHSTGSTRHA